MLPTLAVVVVVLLAFFAFALIVWGLVQDQKTDLFIADRFERLRHLDE
jgi:hypothetical protein